MSLSSDLVAQFVKATNDSPNKKQETTLYGTIVTSGNTNYVRLDGSEILTPISSTTTASDGDRVAVMVKDHSAVVTGNISDPAQNGKSTDDKVASAVSEFEIIIADKVSTKELDAQVGRIDNLVAENVTIKDNLTANSASIDDLTAKNVTVEKTLTANSADIETLKTSTITAEDADLKYATIENLNVANETVHNLSGDYASFKEITTTDFSAVNARIDNITGSVITTEFLDANYAQIDLANIATGSIKSAMIEQGAIGTVQIADGSITDAKIVGLTANKITAGRLDAATIEVVNLNAANITVGTINGQQIAQGTINLGNLSQPLSGTISSASDNALNAIEIANDAKSNAIYSVDVMYALSSSETSEPTTGWSTTAPPWQSGKYMWQKTVTTYGDNTKEESSATCITGAAGQNGTNGKDGLNGTAGESIKTVTNYYLASSSSSGITTSTSGWTTTIQTISSSKPYLWNYEIAKGSSGTTISITSPIIIGHFGTDGATGIGISTIIEYYQVSTSNSTAPTSWMSTVPTLTATNKYLWNYETITYTNNTTKDTLKRVIGAYGDKGSTGAQGATGKGIKSIQEHYYLSTSNTSQTGGSWVSTQPTWTSGQYIWTRSHITWSDDTTNDTPPILADAINKANSTASTASSNASTALSTANTAKSTANSANSIATAAQTTANGKNAVYYQTAAPSGGTYKTNDVWFDTDDGNRMYSWSGSAWVTKQFGTNAIANLAITNAQIADGTIQNAKISNLDAAKITTGTLSAARISSGSITISKLDTGTQNLINDAKKSVYAEFFGAGNANRYFKIATITITGVFINGEIIIGASNIGFGYSRIHVMFQNSSTLDPALIYLKQEGLGTWYINKSATSTWDIYCSKYGRYDVCTIIEYVTKSAISCEWAPQKSSMALPDGCTRATQMIGMATWCYNNDITYINGGKIYTGTIEAAAIKANSITAGQIAGSTITGDKIASETISATNIASNAITSDKIVANAVTAAKMATNTITANSGIIADGAITNAKIDNLSVTEAKIGNASVVTAKIADGAITNAKIANATIENAKIHTLDASKITSGYISADRIKAGSITADKITVTDLQAIGATIGGFTIRQDSLTMGGTYLADDASHFFQADCIYIGKSGISYNNTFCIRSDGSLLSQNPSVSTAKCMINSGSINFGISGKITMSYVNPLSGYDTPQTVSVLYFGVENTGKGPITVSNLVNGKINIVASGGMDGYINMKASSTVGIRAPYINLYSDDVSVKDTRIVARGSNGNGEYIRFYDGTQICLAKRTVNWSATNSYGSLYESEIKYNLGSWPASFLSTPCVSIGLEAGANGIVEPCDPTTIAIGSTYMYRPTSIKSGLSTTLSIVGIGRWR